MSTPDPHSTRSRVPCRRSYDCVLEPRHEGECVYYPGHVPFTEGSVASEAERIHATPDHARERVFQSRITAAMEHAITALNAYPDDRQRALLFCDLAIDAIARAKEDS